MRHKAYTMLRGVIFSGMQIALGKNSTENAWNIIPNATEYENRAQALASECIYSRSLARTTSHKQLAGMIIDRSFQFQRFSRRRSLNRDSRLQEWLKKIFNCKNKSNSKSLSSSCVIVRLRVVLKRTVVDDYNTLPSPGSHKTNYWYAWVQTIY